MLAHTGPVGMARTIQIEYRVTGPMPVEITSVELLVTQLGH